MKKTIKKHDVLEAVECSNFMQKFKILIWEKMKGNFISEKDLDEIAMRMFEYTKKPDYEIQKTAPK